MDLGEVGNCFKLLVISICEVTVEMSLGLNTIEVQENLEVHINKLMKIINKGQCITFVDKGCYNCWNTFSKAMKKVGSD